MPNVLPSSKKLKGDEVVRHAEAESGPTLSVLIQPALKARRVRVSPSKQQHPGQHWSSRGLIVAPNAEDDAATVAEAARFLGEVLHRDFVWLASARSFVADVTADELRRIAAHDSIKAVWCNHEVRR